MVEGFYGAQYQGGSLSLICVGSGFHCLHSFFLFPSQNSYACVNAPFLSSHAGCVIASLLIHSPAEALCAMCSFNAVQALCASHVPLQQKQKNESCLQQKTIPSHGLD
jgi:hypothetical protein